MQDTSTGEMREIPAAMAALLEKEPKLSHAERRANALSTEIQKLTGIPAPFQGPVFVEGEEIELKGGRFVIHKIIKKGLVLHGLPAAAKGGA